MAVKKAIAATKRVAKKAKKKIKSPSAFSVLFAIIAVMAGLTWVIPSGRYVEKTDGTKEYVQTEKVLKVVEEVKNPKTEISVEDTEKLGYSASRDNAISIKNDDGTIESKEINLRQGVWDIFTSVIFGLIDRIQIIIFIFVLGGFLGLVMKTQALDASIGRLVVKMKGREKWLIPILMTLFAIGGTTYGMQEEAVAFYALIIPLMLAAGYNTMTSVMIIVLGAGSGVLASTVNPFSTGAALDAAGKGIDIGKILAAQGVIFVLTLVSSIVFTMRYAAKVKAGKYKEDTQQESKIKALDTSNIPELSIERKFIVGIFAITFAIMVVSLVPWGDFGIKFFDNLHTYFTELPLVNHVFGFLHSKPLGNWYFIEISTLFLISSALISIVYYEKFKAEDKSPIDVFLAGVSDLMSVAFVIAVAAAIGVVMNAGGIQDTIVYWGENLLHGANAGLVGVLAYIFYIPLSIIIPSSSGLAAASMPIIAPVVGGIAGKEVAVVAFATASGLLNMIAPTIASLLAGLSIAGISYKTWVKRVAPIMAVFVIISLIVIFAMGIIK